MAERHHAESAGLQIELRGLYDTRQRMNHDHERAFQALPPFGSIDDDPFPQLGRQSEVERRVHHSMRRAHTNVLGLEPDCRALRAKASAALEESLDQLGG